MSSDPERTGQEISLPFQERIEILFHELELAVKWDRPSILFAIYKSDLIRDQVSTILKGKLAAISQKTQFIKADDPLTFDFMDEITQVPDLSATVLVIDGFNWECSAEGVHVFKEFDKNREYFIDNNIRAIFWLFENEVPEFASKATECWILRHRMVDFVDIPEPEKGLDPSLGSVWQIRETKPGKDGPAGIPGKEAVKLGSGKDATAADAKALLNMGLAHWRKGDPRNALDPLQASAEISTLLDERSLQGQCQNALALVYAELGQIDHAVTAYQQAIALSPRSGFLWNNLGQLLADHERNEEAVKAYKQAITCSPDDFISWDGLGHVYVKLGLHQNAISAFGKALEIAPYYEFSWAGMGAAYLGSGEVENALDPLRKAVELNTHLGEAWLNLAEAHLQMGKSSEALKTYQQALELNPQNPCLWKALGNLHVQNQDFAASLSAFQKVLSFKPECGEAHLRLAYALFQIGDYESSAQEYETSIQLIQDPSTRSMIWNRLGDTYLQMKDYEKAIEAYERSGPTPIDTGSQEDEELDAVEKTDKAGPVSEEEDELEVAQEPESTDEFIQGHPDQERGEAMNEANHLFDVKTARQWNELGNEHLKTGAYNDAITAYTRAIELAPQACWPYIQNLAQVHYQKGKARGRMIAGRTGDLDTMEVEEEGDPAPLFGLDALPTPERSQAIDEPELEDPVEKIHIEETSPSLGSVEAAAEEPEAAKPAVTETCSCVERAAQVEEGLPGKTRLDHPARVEEPGSVEKDVVPSLHTASALEGLENPPRNSIDWNELGNQYARSRNFDEAIAAYKKAVEMNPKYGQPYSNLGLIYYHLGKFDIAVVLFRKSLGLLDSLEDKAIAWNKLGDSYRRLGDYGNALAAYQQASGLSPVKNPVMARSRETLLESVVSG